MITLYTFGAAFGLPDPSPFVTKTEVLLKLSGLPYQKKRANVRKAPKGKLPYIDDDGTIVADSTFIRFHLEDKHGIDFDKGFTPEQRGVAWAVEKLFEDHLYWAGVDNRWMVDTNFDKGPRRFFDPIPSPVRPLVIAMVRRQVKRNMWGHGMGRHSRADIQRLSARGLNAVADILGNKPFLLGDRPCGADATAFAFIAGTLTAFFDDPARDKAMKRANLVAYRDRGMAQWFPQFAKSAAPV